MITAQSIYDTVLAHLRKQGVSSIERGVKDPSCMYRGPNNTSCAVGCLIPDKNYDFEMEHTSVDVAIVMLPKGYIKHLLLLTDLQNAHDYFMPAPKVGNNKQKLMAGWEEEMQKVAATNQLIYTSLST